MTSKADGTLSDIYASISDGNSVAMEFSSKAEAILFNIKLSKYRTRVQDLEVSIGFISENERIRLCFDWDADKMIATWKPAPKPATKTYSFVVLPKEDGNVG